MKKKQEKLNEISKKNPNQSISSNNILTSFTEKKKRSSSKQRTNNPIKESPLDIEGKGKYELKFMESDEKELNTNPNRNTTINLDQRSSDDILKELNDRL